jgi:hypothetical protein
MHSQNAANSVLIAFHPVLLSQSLLRFHANYSFRSGSAPPSQARNCKGEFNRPYPRRFKPELFAKASTPAAT